MKFFDELANYDKEVFDACTLELNRQRENIELIASENIVSKAVLLAAGYLLGICQPIIKRIWSASMVIYSAGWCYLLLALFYWWIDVKGHAKGWNWLLYYGCNAITAYLIGELINFRCIAASLLYGTEQFLGGWYQVLLAACNSLMVFFILWFMYKNRLFLKV